MTSCKFGGECSGDVGCHHCPRCPDRVERVKYPEERKTIVVTLRRWL